MEQTTATTETQTQVRARAIAAGASKDEIELAARAKGWRGDPARVTKDALALYCAEHEMEEMAVPPSTETGARFISATKWAIKACGKCGEPITEGEPVYGDKNLPVGLRYWHARCNTAPTPTVVQAAASAIVEPHKVPAPRVEQKNATSIATAIAAALESVKLGVDPDEIRAAVKAEVAHVADTLRDEITKQVFRVEIKLPDGTLREVGRQHKQFPQLCKVVAAGVNVWVAGPAGSGKTTAAEACARALGLPFSFDGAMDTEYKVVGFTDAQGRIVSTAFRRAYTKGGLHLFDECDASLAPATLAINAALANGYAAFPDGMAKMHPDFRCVAAANTWGLGATFDYVGRNKLDAAFLDRFVRVNWEYDEMLEREVCGNPDWCSYVQTMRVRAKAKGLKVVISPRASIFGARLLAAGMAREEVISLTLRNGMRPEDWKVLT